MQSEFPGLHSPFLVWDRLLLCNQCQENLVLIHLPGFVHLQECLEDNRG